MNLLPEGEPLRAMTRALGAAPEDALGLIAQTGNDLAGALSIAPQQPRGEPGRSEEHTSELQSLMRISYAVFCLKKKTKNTHSPLHMQKNELTNTHYKLTSTNNSLHNSIASHTSRK